MAAELGFLTSISPPEDLAGLGLVALGVVPCLAATAPRADEQCPCPGAFEDLLASLVVLAQASAGGQPLPPGGKVLPDSPAGSERVVAPPAAGTHCLELAQAKFLEAAEGVDPVPQSAEPPRRFPLPDEPVARTRDAPETQVREAPSDRFPSGKAASPPLETMLAPKASESLEGVRSNGATRPWLVAMPGAMTDRRSTPSVAEARALLARSNEELLTAYESSPTVRPVRDDMGVGPVPIAALDGTSMSSLASGSPAVVDFPTSVMASPSHPPEAAARAAVKTDAPLHDHVLPGPTARWGDVLAERVRGMIDQRSGEARLRVNPPELGTVEIKIAFIEERAHVQFTATHPGARDVLEASLPRLRELLFAEGLELGSASVGEQANPRRQHAGPSITVEPSPGLVTDVEDVPHLPRASHTSAVDLYV